MKGQGARSRTRSTHPIDHERRVDLAVARRVGEACHVPCGGGELERAPHKTLLYERLTRRAEPIEVATAMRRRLLPAGAGGRAALPHGATRTRLEYDRAEVALLGVLGGVVRPCVEHLLGHAASHAARVRHGGVARRAPRVELENVIIGTRGHSGVGCPILFVEVGRWRLGRARAVIVGWVATSIPIARCAAYGATL